MPLVDVVLEGRVGRVWLNRPEQHNALTPELGEELISALNALAHHEGVRVIVLGGRGPSFCAGADLGAMKASAAAGFDRNLAEAEELGAMFEALSSIPKPVVARVHGAVFGGGVGLMCACDLPVATRDATFGLTEVRLGILPALISPYVLRRIGDRHARELMLTGERFDGEAALRIGLVQAVCEPKDLDARIEERVRALLEGGPAAQARIKQLLVRYREPGWSEYRKQLARVLADVRSGPEAREGLEAFFARRKPDWTQSE